MKRVAEGKTVTLQGILIPSAWDKDGNVSGVSISTYDEEVYALDVDNRWAALMNLLREKVQIQGAFCCNKKAGTIRIKNVKRVK